uniref:Uncharacterized protein n=1 Tax=Panagrellus redivivus TaxID=6233 RepID=A0A7E4ULM4_PANRE
MASSIDPGIPLESPTKVVPRPFMRSDKETAEKRGSRVSFAKRNSTLSLKHRPASMSESMWRGNNSEVNTEIPDHLKPKRTNTQPTQPGLRALLYGLTQQTEREEAALRKLHTRQKRANNSKCTWCPAAMELLAGWVVDRSCQRVVL